MKKTAVAASLATGVALVGFLVAPAQAGPAPAPTAVCVKPIATRPGVPNRAPDTRAVNSSDAKAARALVRSTLANNRSALNDARIAADPVEVPVRVHILKGSHDDDRIASRTRVNESIDILNDAYAGGQSGTNANAGVHFRIVSWDWTRWDRAYHARPFTKYDFRMRRTLHRGGPGTLNLYFSRPRPTDGSPNLGWSSFPQDYSTWPRLDGVTVNIRSMPRGAYTNYNLGDTTVHEVGHWMGLFHTFEGGCDPYNDGVADTPAEAYPAAGCPEGSDSCPDDPGLDPIHNFMDYSIDPCMDEFTPGQVDLMHSSWLAYRAR